MKKKLFVLLAAGCTLFAYTDMDLDGVDDSVDRCPNTPITDIVDQQGCSVKSVINEHHFDIIAGLAYSQYNYRLNDESDTWTTSLQGDWYYGNFSAQLVTSYYTTDGDGYDTEGMNDTTLAGYYTFKNLLPGFSLQAGAGIIFPTYDAEFDNNNADFLLSLHGNYEVDAETNLFAGYTYTLVGDDDVRYTGYDGNLYEIAYQNTHAFTVGGGYRFTPLFYASLSYFYSDSIYEEVDAIENLSVYGFYTVDEHWFVTGNYAYGLSDTTSDHYFALRLGYYF